MSDGDDIEDEVDPVLDDAEKAVEDTGAAAKEVGEGKQDLEQAERDLSDGDQDTADKASNAGHGAADALDHAGDALEELGISDPGLGDLADLVDDGTEAIFRKKHAPDSLPPVRYRVFFGKKDPLEALGESALGDAMGLGDSLLEMGAQAAGVGDYLGTDPLSSVMAKRSPFAEDPDELDAEESIWKLARIDVDEAINAPWRCEVLLVAPEFRVPVVEDDLNDAASAGGLVDQVVGPIKGAIDTFESARSVGDAALGATGGVGERIQGIVRRLGGLENNPLGVLRDVVFGGAERKSADFRVIVNAALDPGRFLGKTCSVRVSREFSGDPDGSHPNDVPDYPFSARYVSGVVVEMEDLGLRRARTPAGFQPVMITARDGTEERQADGQRWIRLVLMPELAKLSLRRDHRVFNEMSALEIVREVLRSAGVYGLLPDIPGLGVATDFVSDLAGKIPFVGGAVGDSLSGQLVKTVPPPGVSEDAWTMTREMCVQYGETDLDFVRRLLEEEGIHFSFEQRRGFERIVFSHDFATHDETPTVDGRPARYFWPHWSGRPNVETVRSVAERRRMRPSKVRLRDFSFSSPTRAPEEQEEPADAARYDAARPESVTAGAYGVRYEYPGPFPFQYAARGEGETDPEDAPPRYLGYAEAGTERRYAQLRLEEEASRARRVAMVSDLIGAQAGQRLRMRGYPFQRDGMQPNPADDPPAADQVVVERVRWRGGNIALTGGAVVGPRFPMPAASDLADYDSVIHGAWIDPMTPARTPVRPTRRTPKPRITSIQTATVVDYEGDHDEDEEIDVDHLALTRVFVRFHWDRRGELPLGVALPVIGRGTTCRCRVAQPWAGDDYGALFVPRIGAEVAVAFENGDPDRPVVIGSLYDGAHPVPTPGRETARVGFEPPKAEPVQLSTIATRTSPWDEDEGVRSELTFDDTFEAERIVLKAGGHYVEEVRADHARAVGNDQSNEVARHHGEVVEQKQALTVTGARDKTVLGDEKVAVQGRRVREVAKSQRVTIEGDREERVEGCLSLRVDGGRALVIHGMRSTVVGDFDASPPKPAHDLHEVGGAKTDTIEGELVVRANALAVGQPGGPAGDAAPAGRMDARTNEDGDPELRMRSEGGVELEAPRGEVRIESKTGEVDIEITAPFTALVTGSALALGDPDFGRGVQLETDRVQVHAGPSVVVVSDAVWMRTQGEAETTGHVSADTIEVKGRTGVLRASVEVVGGAQVTKVGP